MQSGWWKTTALTAASGSIIMPSVRETPISSGRNSFQINATGNVYQSDRGSANTTHLTIYEPDSNWASCQ